MFKVRQLGNNFHKIFCNYGSHILGLTLNIILDLHNSKIPKWKMKKVITCHGRVKKVGVILLINYLVFRRK